MRLAPRSPWPVAVVLVLIGVAAVGYWLYWLARPATPWDVTDSANGILVFFLTPPALAGLLMMIGGGSMMRWRIAGRVVATVGLSFTILMALYWGFFVLISVEHCTARPSDCPVAWHAVAKTGAAAFLVAVYLIVAVWRSRRLGRT